MAHVVQEQEVHTAQGLPSAEPGQVIVGHITRQIVPQQRIRKVAPGIGGHTCRVHNKGLSAWGNNRRLHDAGAGGT